MKRSVTLVLALGLVSVPAAAQLTAETTGVPTEALQHNFDDYMSFSNSHGQLCQKTLKQTLPGVRGPQQDLTIDFNFSGNFTSRWKQEVTKPDGTSPVIWQLECVSQLRSGRKLFVVSLVMYQQRGAERRGAELLTRRDVRTIHEPR
jgi:hypothetical protein